MGIYSHTGQVVADLERSKRFYTEVLGFKFWYEFQPPEELVAKISSLKSPLGVTASYVVLDGFVLELMQYSVPGVMKPFRVRAMNDPGLTHLSISVDDVRATAKKAVEYGGQILEDTDIGVGLFIRDPDGQLLELVAHQSASQRAPPKP